MDPLIINIKRNSLDDGPGIRTVIFFKGCPLSCVWCQNPESKQRDQEISYEVNSCVKCRACEQACSEEAINQDFSYPIIKDRCNLCGKCVEACDFNALSFVGTKYTINELVNIIRKDKVFYDNSNGGLTLSGGEPTLYPDFLYELLQKIKAEEIHICLETSGYYNRNEFEVKILPFVDLIYFDLKLFDKDNHLKYCNVPNTRILKNFEDLLKKDVEVLPRIPLIPGITTDNQNLTRFAEYLKSLDIKKIGLLPYNPLWVSKINSLGIKASYSHSEWMKKDEK